MDSPEEAEYRNKLSASAPALADKMSVLEARDRLMRMRRSRQTDLATAVAVVGTCPDMCPEFERYFRIETNQVSNFEVDADGTPDEHRMIKEYRRSGADQEEPLAHELRPAPVLMMTMDYLCTNIMDALDVMSMDTNFGEWYDFVWSRSRSIRKDITQQHLCDTRAVRLTEMCARFHIHCAATLCQQDVKDFDPKINEENLSNCLQSLKDFYYDLSLRGVYCDNESEFRCYEILLHLNDTPIIREVQNYRQPIRDSSEVQFAVKAFFAYHSNNYHQFFKLLNQSSYLMACVLHRYFVTMRFKAFKILRKSYTSNNSSVQEYPSQLLIDCLGFEDFSELRQFCDHIGLECNDGFVYLIRGQNQSDAIKPMRSMRLVESKRTVSVGEIINGKPLPPNPYRARPVHNSFGADHKLNAEATEALDQRNKDKSLVENTPQFGPNVLFKPPVVSKPDFSGSIFRPQTSVNAIPMKSKSFFTANSTPFRLPNITSAPPVTASFLMPTRSPSLSTNVDIESSCDDISEEVIGTVIKQLVTEFCTEELKRMKTIMAQHLVTVLFSDIFLETTDDMIESIAVKVINDENDLKAQEMEILEELKNQLCEQLSKEFIGSEISGICGQVLSDCHKEYNEKRIEFIANEFLTEQLDQFTTAIAHRIYSSAREEREAIICLIRDNRVKRLENKYFNQWRDVFAKRKRHKYLKDSFPAAPNWQPKDPEVNEVKYSLSEQSFDDNFSNRIERELLANSFLYHCIDSLVKEIAEQAMELSIKRNQQIFEYFRQKRCQRLGFKYFQKWKSYCCTKKLNALRQSFPAAPNWESTRKPIARSQYSLSCLEPDIKISPKRMRREVVPPVCVTQEESSDSPSNLRKLLEQEMRESQEFTKRLNLSLSNISSHLADRAEEQAMDERVDNDGEDVVEAQQQSKIIVCETLEDKRARLERLLSEEGEYFSLYNFVDYLSTDLVSDTFNE